MPDLLTDRLRTSTEPRFQADWDRQRRKAEDILQRLQRQEGVILADQVGMGKTYVALAVAVSKILSTPAMGQVVAFVPAAVATKWVREWQKFSQSLLPSDIGIRCVGTPLRSGEEFLKALDDPPERRNHLVVVTHTALTTMVKDTFVQLALIYYATRFMRDDAGRKLRERVARWSTGRTGVFRHAQFTPDRVASLLGAQPPQWRRVWEQMTGQVLDDDPVPRALDSAMRQIDHTALREALDALPVRRSEQIATRLAKARAAIADSVQETWRWMLASTSLDLPLLIVDEAHRLKNDSTMVSRLFASRSYDDERAGAFAGIFRNMLFLTATPFELRHDELINVLSRMGAVRPLVPPPAKPLQERLDSLRSELDTAQESTVILDNAWGRLSADDISHFDRWTPDTPAPDELTNSAREAWEHARLAAQAQERVDQALRPWMIRHERPDCRAYHPGRAIAGGSPDHGLDIPESAALPFLLAARAQSIALDDKVSQRPLFAYGIASSYEAFGRLDSGRDDHQRDTDDPEQDHPVEPREQRAQTIGSDAIRWYRSEIDRLLVDTSLRNNHPKIRATVDRAVELWRGGEKCLVFCWFIRTGGAVERALAERIDHMILSNASGALGTDGSETTRSALERISERLFRSDSSSYTWIRRQLSQELQGASGGHRDVLDLVVDTAIRHLRTPSCLVRYTRLKAEITSKEIWDGIRGDNPRSVDLLARWRGFAERLAQARGQIDDSAGDGQQASEFDRVEDALLGSDDDGPLRRGASLHPVRRASGETNRDVRERVITLFNTPFAPDLLVASSVMGEGIDLHQECREVIHHDLDWNPRVLEQRTGRLDRIGSLAEREHRSIDVYEPYLAGTYDEKMFRVVKDRAQWFDVVMGRAAASDERATDAEERRMSLHPKVLRALSMDLSGP